MTLRPGHILRRPGLGIVCAAACLLGPSLAVAQTRDPHELMALQNVLAAAKAKIAPSIVRIETFGGTRRMLAGDGAADSAAPKRPRPQKPPKQDDGEEKEDEKIGPLVMPGFLQAQGATSGIILTSDGWVLISRFAINFDPTTILVTLADGRSFNAVRGGQDTSRGLAVVKIDAQDLPVAEIADPAEIRVGQWAFALGRTFDDGGDPTVHMGIVSACGRLFGRAIQIDAYTSPANYGGPVIDVRGRVMGLSVPLSPSGRDAGVDWYDSGIGFATTLGDIPDILERMREGETLHRGYLGIGFDAGDIGPGVLLSTIADESPAKAAGMAKGDRIVRIDGIDVKNAFHMQMLVSSRMEGDPVQLDFEKGDGAVRGITVFLAPVPQRERGEQTRAEESFVPPWHGDAPPPEEGR